MPPEIITRQFNILKSRFPRLFVNGFLPSKTNPSRYGPNLATETPCCSPRHFTLHRWPGFKGVYASWALIAQLKISSSRQWICCRRSVAVSVEPSGCSVESRRFALRQSPSERGESTTSWPFTPFDFPCSLATFASDGPCNTLGQFRRWKGQCNSVANDLSLQAVEYFATFLDDAKPSRQIGAPVMGPLNLAADLKTGLVPRLDGLSSSHRTCHDWCHLQMIRYPTTALG